MIIKENINAYGLWTAVVKNSNGNTVSIDRSKNLLPTVGRTAMAVQIAGNATQDMKITYLAVGTDSTAPANGNTTLATEVARQAVGSSTNTNEEASIAAFFAAGDIPTTSALREYGAFGDGNTSTASATADTGILYSRAAANISVGATETLTLTYKITFS